MGPCMVMANYSKISSLFNFIFNKFGMTKIQNVMLKPDLHQDRPISASPIKKYSSDSFGLGIEYCEVTTQRM